MQILFKFIIILLTILFPVISDAYDYVIDEGNNATYFEPPTLPKPAKGDYVTDPNTLLDIYRVTNFVTDFSLVEPYANKKHWLFPLSGQFDHLNKDRTLLLLQTGANMELFNANTFAYIRSLRGPGDDWTYQLTSIQWSRKAGEENIFYTVARGTDQTQDCPSCKKLGPVLRRFDVTPCLANPADPPTITTVRNFASDFPGFNWGPSSATLVENATGTNSVASTTVVTDASRYIRGIGIKVGMTVNNTTSGASGTITAIFDKTFTAPLTGGSRQNWALDDAWEVINGSSGYCFIATSEYSRTDYTGRYWPFWIMFYSPVSTYSPAGNSRLIANFTYDMDDDHIDGWMTIDRLYQTGGHCATFEAGALTRIQDDTIDSTGNYVYVKNGGCGTDYADYYDFKQGGGEYVKASLKTVLNSSHSRHGDHAITKQGNPVRVSMSGGKIHMSNFMTGKQWVLATYPSDSLDCHVSGISSYVYPGWALISTYFNTTAAYYTWPTDQIFMIELDETKAEYWLDYSISNNPPQQTTGLTGHARLWRIAHNQNYYPQTGCAYSSQAWAMIDFEGKKILWANNWRNCDLDSEFGTNWRPFWIDTFQITLPATWYTDLGGTTTCVSPAHYNGETCITCSGVNEYWDSVGLVCAECGAGTHPAPEVPYATSCESDCVSPQVWSTTYNECIDICETGQHWDVTVTPHACTEIVLSGNVARNDWMALTSYDLSEVTVVPNFFTFFITDESQYYHVVNNKNIIPGIKSVFYQNALTYGDTLYMVQDTVTGLNIRSLDYGWYLHDFSNSAYRSGLASQLVTELSTDYPQFDGVFLDDVWSDPTSSTLLQDCPTWPACDAPNLPASLATSTPWRANMTLLIQAIKTAIGSKLIIVNTNWSRDEDYLAAADGMMDESFGHAAWDAYNSYLDVTSWINHMNAFIAGQAANKYYIAQCGVDADTDEDDEMEITQAQIDAIAKYCYASFLMGVNVNGYGKHYFAADVDTGLTYRNFNWYSYWNENLGTPSGAYSQIAGKSSYKRVFTNGLVVVNPTGDYSGDEAVQETVDLGGTYMDENGNNVTTAVMNGRQGRFFYSTSKFRLGGGSKFKLQ